MLDSVCNLGFARSPPRAPQDPLIRRKRSGKFEQLGFAAKWSVDWNQLVSWVSWCIHRELD